MHRILSRLTTPSVAIALVALIVALGGSALAAGSGAKVNANTFAFQASKGSSFRTLLSINGLTIRARCTSAGSPQISATTSSNNADLFGHVITGGGRVHAIADDAFHKGVTHNLVAGVTGDTDASGSVQYQIGSGKLVTVNYAFDNARTLNGTNVCTVYGSSLSS